ncbi:MAG: hypothetical protein QOH25_1325 [Acidobacteriota bacterium]|jgi:hypothetical protein|nr:hypothetical protein [Acidobacteriota bacterium]
MWIKALHRHGGKNHLGVLMVMTTLNILLIAFLVSSQGFSSVTAFGDTHLSLQSPMVSVAAQADVPLHITIESVDASNPLAPQVNYAVQNTSGKPIRAYTVLEETATNSSRGKFSTVTNLTSTEQILQPQLSSRETFGGQSFTEPLLSLTLSIDFVEFGDGTTWGHDTQQSAENIAGQRAGGRATLKKLRELFTQQGADDVVAIAKQKNVEVVVPSADRSNAWQDGFRIGHNTILYRLKVAHEKGGSTQLASELKKPFDASDGRQ